MPSTLHSCAICKAWNRHMSNSPHRPYTGEVHIDRNIFLIYKYKTPYAGWVCNPYTYRLVKEPGCYYTSLKEMHERMERDLAEDGVDLSDVLTRAVISSTTPREKS